MYGHLPIYPGHKVPVQDIKLKDNSHWYSSWKTWATVGVIGVDIAVGWAVPGAEAALPSLVSNLVTGSIINSFNGAAGWENPISDVANIGIPFGVFAWQKRAERLFVTANEGSGVVSTLYNNTVHTQYLNKQTFFESVTKHKYTEKAINKYLFKQKNIDNFVTKNPYSATSLPTTIKGRGALNRWVKNFGTSYQKRMFEWVNPKNVLQPGDLFYGFKSIALPDISISKIVLPPDLSNAINILSRPEFQTLEERQQSTENMEVLINEMNIELDLKLQIKQLLETTLKPMSQKERDVTLLKVLQLISKSQTEAGQYFERQVLKTLDRIESIKILNTTEHDLAMYSRAFQKTVNKFVKRDMRSTYEKVYKYIGSQHFRRTGLRFFQIANPTDVGRFPSEIAYRWLMRKMVTWIRRFRRVKPLRLEKEFESVGGIVLNSAWLLGYRVVDYSPTKSLISISFRPEQTNSKLPVLVWASAVDISRLELSPGNYYLDRWAMSRGGRALGLDSLFGIKVPAIAKESFGFLNFIPLQFLRNAFGIISQLKRVSRGIQDKTEFNNYWDKVKISLANSMVSRSIRLATRGFAGNMFSGKWVSKNFISRESSRWATVLVTQGYKNATNKFQKSGKGKNLSWFAGSKRLIGKDVALMFRDSLRHAAAHSGAAAGQRAFLTGQRKMRVLQRGVNVYKKWTPNKPKKTRHSPRKGRLKY